MKYKKKSFTQPWLSAARWDRRVAALHAAVAVASVVSFHSALLYHHRPLPQCLESMRQELGAHARWVKGPLEPATGHSLSVRKCSYKCVGTAHAVGTAQAHVQY
jgi:hypothetical protein